MNDDGTFNVAFEDGDYRSSVPVDEIQADTGLSPAPARQGGDVEAPIEREPEPSAPVSRSDSIDSDEAIPRQSSDDLSVKEDEPPQSSSQPQQPHTSPQPTRSPNTPGVDTRDFQTIPVAPKLDVHQWFVPSVSSGYANDVVSVASEEGEGDLDDLPPTVRFLVNALSMATITHADSEEHMNGSTEGYSFFALKLSYSHHALTSRSRSSGGFHSPILK